MADVSKLFEEIVKVPQARESLIGAAVADHWSHGGQRNFEGALKEFGLDTLDRQDPAVSTNIGAIFDEAKKRIATNDALTHEPPELDVFPEEGFVNGR